jgi:uncharacterized protein (TIGR03118 family)
MGRANPHHPVRTAALGVGLLCALTTSAAAAGGNAYVQTNLVSDQPGVALVTDPNLVNAWGLSASPTSPIWVADNGTELSTLYNGFAGATPPGIVPLVVSIPGGAPTGTVFNSAAGATDFSVTDGTTTARSAFLFDTEQGAIVGWNPTVGTGGNPPPSTTGEVAVTTPGADYKGLALANTKQGARLYAANFTQMRIDVWDGNWMPAAAPGAFTDPALPSDYGPFNVQLIARQLYVAYAQVDPASGDEVAGPGKGIVDVYSLQGRLVRRLVSGGGELNAPWGLARAPGGFGAFSHQLLVGNFGDGLIHAYDIHSGAMLGTLDDPSGSPIQIDGLWALRVANGTFGNGRSVIFSAGPGDESHGLLGALQAAR